tara:strand:+ start:1062 stop:1166 length:105 start_codon:yes stop_codon:yes gene_type:complete
VDVLLGQFLTPYKQEHQNRELLEPKVLGRVLKGF